MSVIGSLLGIVFQGLFFGWLYEVYGTIQSRKLPDPKTAGVVQSPLCPAVALLLAAAIPPLFDGYTANAKLLIGFVGGCCLTGYVFARATRGWTR